MDSDAPVTPLILYVPGLRPKPEAGPHREALFRCLVHGIRRIDAAVADEIVAADHCFDIVSWTYDFYGKHRAIAIDATAIDAVIAQEGATPADIAEASSWRRGLVRWLYTLGDLMPFLMPYFAGNRMGLHLRDLRRYVRNDDDIAEHTRQLFKMRLRAAAEARRPILVIAHSMGSVIAYDGLWQMSHDGSDHLDVDLLLTMGSPLGQNYIQKRIKGHAKTGTQRYPTNIRRWVNMSAVGDLTAVDPELRNDFKQMVETGLVEEMQDVKVLNYFRLHRQLNVHSEYGYLVNEATARIVIEWWRTQSRND